MKPDGGPAFPSHGTMGEVAQSGMSLRDYFAAAALPAILKLDLPDDKVLKPGYTFEQVGAEISYRFADAMLTEREKS